MSTSDHPEIFSPQESTRLRARYVETFIDTRSDHYRQYIARLQKFSDGLHYTGYLWDCLRNPERISVGRLHRFVNESRAVLVMADNHSRDRIIGAPLWPYPPNSVVSFKSQVLLPALIVLPEDLYFFDASLSWTLVLTHEHDGQQRICYSVGNLGA